MGDGTVRLATHTPFDYELGSALPVKRVVHSKGEMIDAICPRKLLYAAMSGSERWKKGGKNRVSPDSGVRAPVVTPDRVELAACADQSAPLTFGRGWGLLLRDATERQNLLDAMRQAEENHGLIARSCVPPQGGQVITDPLIWTGYIEDPLGGRVE